MPTIVCENINRRVAALNGGATVRDSLLAEGVGVFKWPRGYCPTTLLCRGGGWCGNCVIEVVAGAEHLGDLTGTERKQFGPQAGNRRLACQCVARGDITIRVRP